MEKLSQWANIVIAVCPVGALLIGVKTLWLVNRQLELFVRQLREGREISRLDQRAWVALVEIGSPEESYSAERRFEAGDGILSSISGSRTPSCFCSAAILLAESPGDSIIVQSYPL